MIGPVWPGRSGPGPRLTKTLGGDSVSVDNRSADLDSTGQPEPVGPGRRAAGPEAAIQAATRIYLRGEPLDMSALATELGIGRATLYRWVGNREDLLSVVLAEGTERTYRAAIKGAQGQGVALILDSLRRFMTDVLETPALKALTQREPLPSFGWPPCPGRSRGEPRAWSPNSRPKQPAGESG